MSDKLLELLAAFREEHAEKCYGEYYQFCTSDKLDAAGAEKALAQIVSWIRNSESPLAKSYGLLMLGGLVDSAKLTSKTAAPLVIDLFTEQSQMVTDFDVLNDQHRFVHFVSHFAYLAGSCVEHFNDETDNLNSIITALVELYLRAPTACWCGEEMLVARAMLEANLSESAFAALLALLNPDVVMQDADNWDDAAAMRWQNAIVREHHKRQLAMALIGANVKLEQKPSKVFDPLISAHYGNMFG